MTVLIATTRFGTQVFAPDNVPLTFYGKVVDQDGRPLAGAKVDLEISVGDLVPVPESPAGFLERLRSDKATAQSGSNGLFSLIGFSGHGIDIKSISKTGYKLSAKVDLSYTYVATARPFHPDAKHPVVFKMWKLQGKEPLIEFSWSHKVPCDGSTNRFSLATGRLDPNGMLEICCTRVPSRLPYPGNRPFAYTFEIGVLKGGIQPTDDDFSYSAPMSGYAPSFIESKKAGEQGWRSSLKQEFYIKTAEGHYGRLAVEWYSWQDSPTHLMWDCSINPSGSRNLER